MWKDRSQINMTESEVDFEAKAKVEDTFDKPPGPKHSFKRNWGNDQRAKEAIGQPGTVQSKRQDSQEAAS